MGIVQIDSVQVVERAHHLTLFSRLGGHDPGLLWRGLEEKRLFEFWGRMASFLPIEDFPLFRFKMDRYGRGRWTKVQELNARRPGFVESVYRQVADSGPLTTADLAEPGERAGPWWGWADGKVALEYLFASGRIGVPFRRNFTRHYDVIERVIPGSYLVDAPPAEEAIRQLILRSARAQGVATAKDLVDYYWIRLAEGRPVITGLVGEGLLVEVEVEGWRKPAYLWSGVSVPRSMGGRSLINPFDPYAWNRDRLERLHDFRYRIEIYVPQPKRVYGYYVFPFLLGEHLVARVDLKADRQTGALRVPGAFLEESFEAEDVVSHLADELAGMSQWLGLETVVVGEKGDMAPALAAAVGASSG